MWSSPYRVPIGEIGKYPIRNNIIKKFSSNPQRYALKYVFREWGLHFLYSRFVKSTNHALVKDGMKTDSMLVTHTSRVMHAKNNLRKNSQKSNFIWVPKNACLIDRNFYISDFKKNICKSVNYLCKNKGKPNSNWVWFPKV